MINKHLKMGAQKGNLVVSLVTSLVCLVASRRWMAGLLRFMIMMANVVVFLWCGTTKPKTYEDGVQGMGSLNLPTQHHNHLNVIRIGGGGMRWNETHHDRRPLEEGQANKTSAAERSLCSPATVDHPNRQRRRWWLLVCLSIKNKMSTRIARVTR